jgi:purine-binding chemotaxis protein CheW
MTTANSSPVEAGKRTRKRGIPIITFHMGNDVFGFHIARVKEVVRYLPLTRIPRAPDYMPGIINLRGGVVTVVDLAMRFGLPPVADPAGAFVIVVEIIHEDMPHLVGLRVDFVQEVLMVDPDLLDVSPRIGGLIASEYVEGVFLNEGSFVTLLNLDLAFDINELLNRAKSGPEQEPAA